MTRDELWRILDTALERTAGTLVPHVKDRPAQIPRWRSELLAARLEEPVEVFAPSGGHARSCGFERDGVEGYALAVTDLGWNRSWLIYEPSSALFWLAWGRAPDALELSGFDGHDPLEVWLS